MHTRSVAVFLLFCITCLLIAVPVAAEDYSDWFVKARNAATLGNYATAIQYYDNALSQNPGYASAYAGKALALNKLGRYGEAIATAEKALSIKTDADALNARAFALLSLGRDAEAVAAYDALFAVVDNSADGYRNQGKAYIRLNETEKGIAAFDRCVRIEPGNLDCWNQKGLALLSLGRYREALDAYNRCTQITTKNAEIWNNKGLAFAGLEDYNKALDSFKMAINLDPTLEAAQANLDKAYLRKPFVTPSATSIPATVPVPVTTGTLPQTTPPTPARTAVTTAPAAGTTTPLEEPTTAVKTTYAPLPPLLAASAIAFVILLGSRLPRRPA